MLRLTVLFALTVFFNLLLKKNLQANFFKQKAASDNVIDEYNKLSLDNQRLKNDNLMLLESAEETTALYELAKKICKTLKEEEVFTVFSEHVNKNIGIKECRFIKEKIEPSDYKGYMVLAVSLHNDIKGYLLAGGIQDRDKEKFHILAQQFLVGIRRVFLYQKVQEMAITDSLTEIFNRRYFLERFEEELRRSKKYKYQLSFLMVDVDYFKKFNDNYGHLVGDAILKEISRSIKDKIRQIDLVGRFGGEEITIVLPETDKEQACFAAERIRQEVQSKDISVYDEKLKVTVSIGIATYPDDASGIDELIDKADKAMYEAKQAGRNRVIAA